MYKSKMKYIKFNKKKQGDCNKLYYYNILNVISLKKIIFFMQHLNRAYEDIILIFVLFSIKFQIYILVKLKLRYIYYCFPNGCLKRSFCRVLC